MEKRKSKKHPPTEQKATVSLKYASGMDAAAAMLKVSKSRVKAAKSAGCQAFHPSNRIHLETLASWLKENPEILPDDPDSESIPNIEIEEAFKMRADRQRSEQRVLREARMVVPINQPQKAFAIVSKLFISRLYILEDRLSMMFKIPKEEIRRELDSVLETLDATQFDKLLTDGDKAES